MPGRFLSYSQVKDLVTMKDIVDIVDRTYRGMAEGTVINPTKGTLDLGENSSYPPYRADINSMPAYVGWVDTAGIKWAGGWTDNPSKGLPYVSAVIVLVNPHNGVFTAVMDGTYITNMRTGAQTAVALKYLLGDKRAISLGIYGAGVQGRTQTMAISEVTNIDRLRVYDISSDAAETFLKDMGNFVKGDIEICTQPEDASESDVVVTVTHSKDKFFKREWFRPGTILFPMGSFQECEEQALLSADMIVVDHVAQCLHRGALKELGESGRIKENDIYSTLGELAAGTKKSVISKDKRILCIPIGTGAVDIAIAAKVLEKAGKKDIGTAFDLAE